MSTLYIDRKDIHIKLDGNAIAFYSNGKKEGIIPLEPVKRVIFVGNMSLETSVVKKFIELGISAIFLSGRRLKFAGILHGRLHNNGLLRLRQYEKAHSEFVREYAQEIVKRKIKAQMNLLDEVLAIRHDLRLEIKSALGILENILDRRGEVISFFMPRDKAKWNTVKRLLGILFWSLIIEELINKELNPHNGILHRNSAFGLVRDYAYIMASEMDLQALQFFRSDSIDHLIESSGGAFLLTARGIQNIINRFENRQYISKNIIKNITDKLFELLD